MRDIILIYPTLSESNKMCLLPTIRNLFHCFSLNASPGNLPLMTSQKAVMYPTGE